MRWPSFLSSISCGLLRPRQHRPDSQTKPPEEGQQCPVSPSTSGSSAPKCAPSIHFPLTEAQIELATQHFIDSIEPEAICDIVARHNGGKRCTINTSNVLRGSFNVCFAAHFDDADISSQIVRVPIIPVHVGSAWDKVLSEVATMRLVKHKTDIPVPRVLACGKDDNLVRGLLGIPYILMDLVPGQQLHTKDFLNATKLQRKQLFFDIIGIFAQLRKLEFPTGGSLEPNSTADDIVNPKIGRFLSMTGNEFEKNSGKFLDHETFGSVKGFVDYHSRILEETFQLPTEELSYRDAQMELFALESLSREIPRHIDLAALHSTFVLAHPDLRPGNILIDDDFHIVNVIDWEFASTVPLQLFMPPSWITGHDPDILQMMRKLLHGPSSNEILAEFCEVLHSQVDDELSSWRRELQQAWGDEALRIVAPIAQILRHPTSLLDVYYPSVFRRLHGSLAKRDTVVTEFFAQPEHRSLVNQVETQIANSLLYTQHLAENRLLSERRHDQSKKIQEFLKQTEHLISAA